MMSGPRRRPREPLAHAVSPESADVVRQQSITEIAHHYGLSWSTVMAVVTAGGLSASASTGEAWRSCATGTSGPISLTLQNEGKQVHRAYFALLNQGVTEQDVRSALSKSPDALFSLITLAGSMPEVEAGDFYFEISDPTSGEATVEITDVGEQGHEVGIGRDAVKGDGEEVTTIFAPAPGGTMWATVTLEPGDYTLLCFLPDPKTGKPHVKLGMKKNFTVK